MPTLIRLVITLLFLAGLVYGGMIALVAYVQPKQKEVTIRIPASELLKSSAPATPQVIGPKPTAAAPAAEPIAPGANSDTPE
ncbi:hypothetical protein [Devosia sp.]|uniref:hypothetical protein n=1 Tax=Devosia sp. TaxID=1871048 RepID=UPI0032640151